MKKSSARKPVKRLNMVFPQKSTALNDAELSLQRGDFGRAEASLRQRIAQGASDFKTRNMLGVCRANQCDFRAAASSFETLLAHAQNKFEREKVGHNLALVQLYEDLCMVGDFSISKHTFTAPTMVTPLAKPMIHPPFTRAIATWKNAFQRAGQYSEVLHTFLAFAYLEAGELNPAIEHISKALYRNENFYIGQYVLGKIFMDLFQLAQEGNDFFLTKRMMTFFEIEPFEILKENKTRGMVSREALLDIAMQAFLDGRELNAYSPECHLGLCHVYLLLGMYEEAEQSLCIAESLSPDALPVLDTQLLLYEQNQHDPGIIRAMIRKIGTVRKRGLQYQVHHILPPYYLL